MGLLQGFSHSGQGSCNPNNFDSPFSFNFKTKAAASPLSCEANGNDNASALAIIAKESTGLEGALSLLRLEFEKLKQQEGSNDEESLVVDPEDSIFGSLAVSPHDIDMTLLRYLKVARSSLSRREKEDDHKLVEAALERIRSTLKYRKDYDVLAMHAPGMARKIMYHDTNPGACLYAADAGLTDKKGRPALIGRLGLMINEDAEQHEPIVPANHLRAVMFAFERLASSLRLSEGKDRALYILDCSMDKTTAPDLYDDVDPRPRNWSRFGSLSVDGLTMSGWKNKDKKRDRTIPGVLPHLDYHQTISPGLPVLREALRQLTLYYPNVVEKVYFVRAPFSFRAFMKVMKLMVDKESAEKFVVVPWGSEKKMLLDVFHENDLPVEFGGKGPSLGRDDFLRIAADRYEEQASPSPLPSDNDVMSKYPEMDEVTSKAMSRSKTNDEIANISSTKDEAISINEGELIDGTGVRLFVSNEDDEEPLGTFNKRTELVILPHQSVKERRKKLIWPIGGWVEMVEEEDKAE